MSRKVSNLRETFHSLLVLLTTVVVILWLSIFCYGTFYYFYIPSVLHVKPVYLQFDTSCQTGICSFPMANVSLVQKNHDQLLTSGQLYKIYLDLEMPESAKNRQLGMFMVKLRLFAQDGLLLKASFRTGLLHYKSNLLRYLNTLIFAPFLLTGSWEEKQTVTVLLFDNYIDHPDIPAYMASVELHSRTIEIYTATLRINAHFSGLRYYMYYWPVFSAMMGIAFNFYFLSLFALFSWYRLLQWQKSIEYVEPFLMDRSPATDNEPFTPVPLDLEASGKSEGESNDKLDVSGLNNEFKKSKEDLSHSSVQDLHFRRNQKKTSGMNTSSQVSGEVTDQEVQRRPKSGFF